MSWYYRCVWCRRVYETPGPDRHCTDCTGVDLLKQKLDSLTADHEKLQRKVEGLRSRRPTLQKARIAHLIRLHTEAPYSVIGKILGVTAGHARHLAMKGS